MATGTRRKQHSAGFKAEVALAAKLSILEACRAVDVLQQVFRHPVFTEIVNTDQGSQFTVEELGVIMFLME